MLLQTLKHTQDHLEPFGLEVLRIWRNWFVFQGFTWLWWWIVGGTSLLICPGPTDSCSSSPGNTPQNRSETWWDTVQFRWLWRTSSTFCRNSLCLCSGPAVFRVKMNMAACCAGRWYATLTWRRSSSSAPSAPPSASASRPSTTCWRQVRALLSRWTTNPLTELQLCCLHGDWLQRSGFCPPVGFMTPEEKKVFEDVRSPHLKYWVPVLWFSNLASKARQEGRIQDNIDLQSILKVTHQITR